MPTFATRSISAIFLTALGFALAFTGGLPAAKRAGLIAAGLATMLAVYAAIVPLEEEYLRATFGEAFDDYARRVPRVVPRRTAAQPQAGAYEPSVIVNAESRTFLTFGAMLLALGLKAATAEPT